MECVCSLTSTDTLFRASYVDMYAYIGRKVTII